MRWRRRYDYVRPPRPKARSLTADEREQLLAKLNAGIECSPILRAFAVQVRTLRGRFYLEWQWNPADGPEQRCTHGRLTPLGDPSQQLLLEVQHRKNQWSQIDTGSPEKLIKLVAGDTQGTFHGLGSLNTSLRKAAKAGLAQLPVKQIGPVEFVYAETEKPCSVQEALCHFFGLPIHVIAQPAGWYSYHRTPRIVECSKDRTGVLVRFTSTSWSGESFGGTCLYLNREGQWAAYTIRPNQSDNIATAKAWLIKRNWTPWS